MKIGIVLAVRPNHNNYGTSLQAYAMLKKLQDFEVDFEIIKYKKHRSIREWITTGPYMLLADGFNQTLRKIKKRIALFFYKKYRQNNAVRTNVIEDFKQKYFYCYNKMYEGFEFLKLGSLNYDLVLVGSDQVWRPLSLYSRYWNLLFVADEIPKVSYASSFGVSQIPLYQIKETKQYLERFSFISVREESAKSIVESISSQKAIVVADPTLLLTENEWRSFSEESTFECKEPYIFCYVLGKDPQIRSEIKKLKVQTGLKVVYLRHVEDYISDDEKMGDYYPYNVSPKDFVKLIANATFVCTNSFHGTVFSIIFHRQFLSFYRDSPNKKKSTHSRLDNLFNVLGIEGRWFKTDVLSEITVDIDYQKIDERLMSFRKFSISSFKEALAKAKC